MTWDPHLSDYIGIEIPFTEPPIYTVPLLIEVVFPDTDALATYVYPSLWYELHGPGIDPSPRLLNTNATVGGAINVEPLCEKLRVYLNYDAQPGPLGTLPHGDLRKSLLTVKAGNGYSVPTLGVRVHELILDTNSSRITMFEGTTMGLPALFGASNLEPIVTGEAFRIPQKVDAVTDAYWTRFGIIEPADHPLTLNITAYDNSLDQSGWGCFSGAYAACGADGTTFMDACMDFHVGAGNRAVYTKPTLYSQVGNQPLVLVPRVDVASPETYTYTIPAGTTALFFRCQQNVASYTTYQSYLPGTPIQYSYFRAVLQSNSTNAFRKGLNWRIPTYNFFKVAFQDRTVAAHAPWAALVAGLP